MPSRQLKISKTEYDQLPTYIGENEEKKDRKDGDIIIQFDDDGRVPFHCNLVTSDGEEWIHSRHGGVVRGCLPNGPAVVYRYEKSKDADDDAGKAAARVAEKWVKEVGYSSGPVLCHLTGRAFGAWLGSWKHSDFGPKARGRLEKYRSRKDLRPKNMICSGAIPKCGRLLARQNSLFLGVFHVEATLSAGGFRSTKARSVGRQQETAIFLLGSPWKPATFWDRTHLL